MFSFNNRVRCYDSAILRAVLSRLRGGCERHRWMKERTGERREEGGKSGDRGKNGSRIAFGTMSGKN